MKCNLISFLGKVWTPMKLSKHLKVSTAGFPNTNLSYSGTNQQVCEYALLKWKGKDRLGLLADGWAVPWGGKKYEFELCQTEEETDTLPQFINTLERLLKSSFCKCLSCKVGALHGATCSPTPWMSVESSWTYCGLTVERLKGLSKRALVKISLSLQSEYSYLCLGCSRKRR